MTAPHIHVPFHHIVRYIGLILEHRINLEIYFSSDTLDRISREDILSVRDSLTYQPEISIHAPFMDLCPAAIDSRILRVTRERFQQVFEIARILSPKIIVFHSGYEKWKYALQVEPWLERSVETWSIFIEKAWETDTKIAIENIFEDEPSPLRMLMERLHSERFGVCFDTGHFNIFARTPLHEWLDAIGDFIIECHIHDNDRSEDHHLPPGDGTFPFPQFFGLLGDRDIVFTIENHNPEQVLKSIERFGEFKGWRHPG